MSSAFSLEKGQALLTWSCHCVIWKFCIMSAEDIHTFLGIFLLIQIILGMFLVLHSSPFGVVGSAMHQDSRMVGSVFALSLYIYMNSLL